MSCTNKAPVYCEICFTEDVPVGQAFGLGCGHVFCRDCWSGYLSSAVNGTVECRRNEPYRIVHMPPVRANVQSLAFAVMFSEHASLDGIVLYFFVSV